jgi:uncharacterized protein YjbI with pentapeptide repeats
LIVEHRLVDHDKQIAPWQRQRVGAIFDLASLPRVDFTGANLEHASLYHALLDRVSLDGAQLQGATLQLTQLKDASLGCRPVERSETTEGGTAELVSCAQLQGASLRSAQLQGASLEFVHLQGASLDGAQLQGASLLGAELQGASLAYAQLQGASLRSAQLQGASLQYAQLQGASLDGAQLQGASLASALLRGASLRHAGLQGASLADAILEVADLTDAYLWRTSRPERPSTLLAIRISDEPKAWLPQFLRMGKPQPWDDKTYQELRNMIASLTSGVSRDQALERIQSLDCANPDKTLASCDPSAAPPPEATAWRKALEAARVDEKVYATALTKIILKELVCSDRDNAIPIVRGTGFQDRLLAAGPAAIDLIDDLMNKDTKDCPVSASLTDAALAKLLQTKRNIETIEANEAIKKEGK